MLCNTLTDQQGKTGGAVAREWWPFIVFNDSAHESVVVGVVGIGRLTSQHLPHHNREADGDEDDGVLGVIVVVVVDVVEDW